MITFVSFRKFQFRLPVVGGGEVSTSDRTGVCVWHLWKLMSSELMSVLMKHTHTWVSALVQTWLWTSCYVSVHTEQSPPPHLQQTISTLPDLCDVSSLSGEAAAEKQLRRSELRKEQASLAREEMPSSAFLYLSIAPAPAPDEIRKVGQWRAKEGCNSGRLRVGREGDECAEEKWEGGGLCMGDTRRRLEPRLRHSLSWFDFLLCCSTYSAHCNGFWGWTWTWWLLVKGIRHLKQGRCLFSSGGLLAYLSEWTSMVTGKLY